MDVTVKISDKSYCFIQVTSLESSNELYNKCKIFFEAATTYAKLNSLDKFCLIFVTLHDFEDKKDLINERNEIVVLKDRSEIFPYSVVGNEIKKGKNAEMSTITMVFQETMSGHKRSSSTLLTLPQQKIRKVSDNSTPSITLIMNLDEVAIWFRDYSNGLIFY